MTQDRRKTTWITAAVIVWTYMVTISRAIRYPNDFAEAHWLLDYRFGFMKRGLVGSICSLVTDAIGVRMSSELIAVLALTALLGMSAALLHLPFRMSRRQWTAAGYVLGLIFASSPFVVMSAHLLGYFDALLYIVVIASVMLVLRGRPLPAAVLSSFAILIHESYLLLGLPLVCLATIAALTANRDRESEHARYVLPLILPVVVFILVVLLQSFTTDAAILRAQLAERLDSVGFVASRSEGVAIWQTTSLLGFLREHHVYFADRLLNPPVLASIVPTFLMMLVSIHLSFRIRAFSPFSLVVLGMLCAPLLLHAVAWDTARIATYPIAGGLIACWILVETRRAYPASGVILLIALPALLFNVFGEIPLMDGKVERFSSLLRLLLYLPALALIAAMFVKYLRQKPFAEFKQAGNAGGSIGSEEQ